MIIMNKKYTIKDVTKRINRFFLVLPILILLSPIAMSGQSTCNTAVTQINGSAVEHNLNNTEYWIKFTADTTYINVQLFQPNNSPYSQLLSVELFSGSCSSLSLLSSMNLTDSTMTENNLVNGNTYYLKLTQSQSASSYAGIILSAPNCLIQ